MKNKLITFLIGCFLIGNNIAHAQECPANIGFETGGFTNWKTFVGSVAFSSSGQNVITLNPSAPTPNQHTIMTSKTAVDPWGLFPVLAPNGSDFSVKLGNEGTQRGAEGISYLITVPADRPSFVITYQYAVVFQDPGHTAAEQPRFTAKVLDISTNTYINCASFEYISTSNLPGFKASSRSGGVLYKNWTPVTINLSGYQGKQLLLEFNTADCTRSGHFGYAYVDVNENCNNIIQGNSSCVGSIETNLKGPSGYETYKWYNADRSIFYGEGENIAISPQLRVGDVVVLDLIPFSGFGCVNTVSTTIVQGEFELNVTPLINACKGEVLDLSSSSYILNKHPQVIYKCYTDAQLKIPIDIKSITTSGTYYVKAISPIGCTTAKSIQVIFNEIAVDVTTEVKGCAGTVIDLTSKLVQKSVQLGLTVSYFSDAALTVPLPDPTTITVNGDYYIKYQSIFCTISKKVNVEIFPLPILKLTDPAPICSPATVDLTNAAITVGSDPDITYTYYKDAALTLAVSNSKTIAATGDYYVKAVSSKGCVSSGKVHVEIYSLPVLTITKPTPVCFPKTIDITNTDLYVGTTAGVTFTYTDDKSAVVSNPQSISQSGTYIVTIQNANGCKVSKTIEVVIYPQPVLVINQPKKVFLTQSVDITKADVIKGSSGYSFANYWYDAQMTLPLDNPKQVTKSGQYYISLTNTNGCTQVAMVEVITVEWPKIMVPTAFTPLKSTNNILYPFYEGIKKLNSFKIYNKWGNLVFETNSMDPAKGWNGTFRNSIQPLETYSWFAEGVNLLDEIYTTKGKTILIP